MIAAALARMAGRNTARGSTMEAETAEAVDREVEDLFEQDHIASEKELPPDESDT